MARSIFVQLSVMVLLGCGTDSGKTAPHRWELAQLAITGPGVLRWESLEVGNSSSRVLTVQNIGGSRATQMVGRFTVSAFDFTNHSYPGSGGSCLAELESGASCSIEILFIPGYAGTFEETVRIQYFNGVSMVSTDGPLLLATSFAP